MLQKPYIYWKSLFTLAILLTFAGMLSAQTKIAHWTFDNNLTDNEVPGGPTLTTFNAIQYSNSGQTGIDLNSSTRYATADIPISQTAFTFTGWFYNDGGSFKTILCNSKTNGYHLFLHGTDNYLAFKTINASGTEVTVRTGNQSFNSASWVFYAIIVDRANNTCSIYLNSTTEPAATGNTSPQFSTSGTVYFGRTPQADAKLYGRLDDLRFYDGLLNNSHLSQIKAFGDPIFGPQENLTVNVIGNGTVSPGSGSYDQGSIVNLTATPDAHHSVTWSGDASGNSNNVSVVMDNAKTVTATFVLNQYLLDLGTSTNGSVTVKNAGNADITSSLPLAVDAQSTYTLEAVPAPDYKFDNWSGSLGTANPLSLTMDGAHTVTANFSLESAPTYNLNITVSGNGSVTPPNGSYSSDVTLVATPGTGYRFDGWSGDLAGTSDSISITMNSDKNITATFSTNPSEDRTSEWDKDVNGNISFSSGNISVGTTASESFRMQVNGNSSFGMQNGQAGITDVTTFGSASGLFIGDAGSLLDNNNTGLNLVSRTNLKFFVDENTGSSKEVMIIDRAGNVGIGTADPAGYKLAVNGNIHAKKIVVEATGWADFVFEKDYQLRSLREVETFINENGHLPEVPAAGTVESEGISLGEMDATLLQKIEELTLYILQQQKEIEQLRKELEEVKNK